MSKDEERQVVALLDEWYAWQSAYRPALGFRRSDGRLQYRIPDARDDEEQRWRESQCRLASERAAYVDRCIDSLTWQQRSAIQTCMLRRSGNARVWHSPRFDATTLDALLMEAMRILLNRFIASGLIEGHQETSDL